MCYIYFRLGVEDALTINVYTPKIQVYYVYILYTDTVLYTPDIQVIKKIEPKSDINIFLDHPSKIILNT